MFAQHINNDENVVIISVESRVKTHVDQIRLPQVIVSANYDASSWKISSRWSVQFLYQPTLFGIFLLKHRAVTRKQQSYLFKVITCWIIFWSLLII